MTERLAIVFGSDGVARAVYSEIIDLSGLGRLEIGRATSVEFYNAGQVWTVTDNSYLVRFAPATELVGFDTGSRAFALGPWNGGWDQPKTHWGADAAITEAEDAVLDLMRDSGIDGFVGPTNLVRWRALEQWTKTAGLGKAA